VALSDQYPPPLDPLNSPHKALFPSIFDIRYSKIFSCQEKETGTGKKIRWMEDSLPVCFVGNLQIYTHRGRTLDPDKLSDEAAKTCNLIPITGGAISSISIWEIGIKTELSPFLYFSL
jgi:hypothetical protein